nr:FeoA domain-containing protein [Petrotogaceae bacterium]
EKVRVIEILGSEQIHKRLIIMGITTGIEVEVLKVAPLGDPIEIKIRDYSIAIRKSEAKEVLVIK